ncbi:alginate export family protein [Rhizorhabdus phycosphaerae]|uniref:alginate export family protein n=1 Tax=Rhizorhabdus phycosphaerae TaxID=2711156 RepID=UPI0013ED3177|nr:alginate export family protein [Rhizorhabdus phycosphaerae]
MASACLCFGVALLPAPARAANLKPIVDLRFRYEGVDQKGFDKPADATTLRGRLGVEATQGPLSLLVEGEATLALDESYFSGLNRKTDRPLVPDPENVELNRAQIQYRSEVFTFTGGRQRVILDDQRFIGTAAWRQNEQTYDAARVEWHPTPKLKVDLTYAWALRTVWGVDGGARGFVTRPQAIDGNNIFAQVSAATRLGALSGFFYRIEENEPSQILRRNSSDSYGASLVGSRPLGAGWKGGYSLRFAHQQDNGVNPLDYAADYFLVEGGLEKGAWKLGLGLEQLGGDRSVVTKAGGTPFAAGFAFQTPFGLLHKFQGWADKFVATPPLGVADHYASVGYGWQHVGPFDTVAAIAIAHHFRSAEGDVRYGDEVDLRLTATMGRYAFLVKYADYRRHRQPSFPGDATVKKLWVSGEWIF